MENWARARKGTGVLGAKNLDKDAREAGEKHECEGKPGDIDGATLWSSGSRRT